jgi:hypothetical protein
VEGEVTGVNQEVARGNGEFPVKLMGITDYDQTHAGCP